MTFPITGRNFLSQGRYILSQEGIPFHRKKCPFTWKKFLSQVKILRYRKRFSVTGSNFLFSYCHLVSASMSGIVKTPLSCKFQVFGRNQHARGSTIFSTCQLFCTILKPIMLKIMPLLVFYWVVKIYPILGEVLWLKKILKEWKNIIPHYSRQGQSMVKSRSSQVRGKIKASSR